MRRNEPAEVSSLRRILAGIRRRLYKTHDSLWYVKDLSAPDETLPGFEGFAVDFDAFEEVLDWIRVKNRQYPWMYSGKEAAVAREYGHLLPCVRFQGEIVGYTKVALNKVYIRDYEALFDLAPTTAMFYDTTILPEFRGKKLPRLMKNQIFKRLKSSGIRHIFCHIEAWNTPSILSNKGAGFKEFCTNKYRRILFHRHYSVHPRQFLATRNPSIPR